eukprot:scaffold73736_cov54-Phaeocystis_antarctica.AAC.1
MLGPAPQPTTGAPQPGAAPRPAASGPQQARAARAMGHGGRSTDWAQTWRAQRLREAAEREAGRRLAAEAEA